LYDTNEEESISVKGESMMKRTSKIMATILTLSILFSGLALGAQLPSGPSKEPGPSMAPPPPHCGPHEPPMPGGMRLLLMCQQINVLSELTGLTQENVRQLLISSRPPAILDAYGVPFDAFITAMDKQVRKAGQTGRCYGHNHQEAGRGYPEKDDTEICQATLHEE
jgi:hypothetical protein